ncbi:MAG: VTT domain-containing protein [Phycisphaeraceae bacterium]
MSLIVLVVSLIVLARLLPVDLLIDRLTRWVEQMGAWGQVIYGAVYVLAAVLFVPGSALTLAAGAIFGLFWGTITVSLASTTAAALSFLIARYLARDMVRRWAEQSPKFGAIDRAIGAGGWKIIALLRLSPAVPFSLGNYLFGLTSIRFWPYVITSWLAMLPGTLMYVYIGYAGRAGLDAAAGASQEKSPGQWALLIIGLLATVAVTVYVTRIARNAIRQQTDLEQASPQSEHEEEMPQANHAKSGITGTLVLAVVALAFAGAAGYGYTNKHRIAGLFGPPRTELKESYQPKPNGPKFDHSRFDAVLNKYVSPEGGWVDYAGLAKDQNNLNAYIESLATAPIDDLGRNERLALLINAYNAFTLRLILDHYPVRSIKDIPAAQRWDAKRWNLGGQTVSLNEIEHEWIRPNFVEPRIHFALVCAAVGCPPLRHEAYTGSNLEEQLEDQAVYTHTHERWFRYDPENHQLWLTSLYDWYGDDFKQVVGSAVAFAARYSQELKAELDAGHLPKVHFLDYDWSLNSKDNQP